MRKVLWTVVVGTVVLVGIYASTFKAGPAKDTNLGRHVAVTQVGPDTGSSSTYASTARRVPAGPAAEPQARIAPDANPYLRDYQSATDRRATFEKLSQISDPIAAYTAAQLARRCGLYGDGTYAATLRRIEQQPIETQAARKTAAQRERSKCVGVDLNTFSRATQLMQYVSESGNPRRLTTMMGNPQAIQEQITVAQQAAATMDPLAIEEVGLFFAGRHDFLPDQTVDLGNGLRVTPSMMRDAFLLAACSFGEDCGADNSLVTSRCVNIGFCGARSLEESLTTYTYAPADAERVVAARDIVVRAIQTGQWPDGFWSASH